MKSTVKRANLFLIELILNLFIFVLCAAVCVGLLVHAKTLTSESSNLSSAVYAAQTAASQWQNASLTEENGWQTAGGAPAQYFDANWTLIPTTGTAPEDWRFCLRLDEVETDLEELISAEITVSQAPVGDQTPAIIYTLAISAARGVTAV